MLKNLKLLLDVTSTKFVTLFFAVFHGLLEEDNIVTENSDTDFFAVLFTIEALSHPELLEILIAVEQPLLYVALLEGFYPNFKEEYKRLTEYLKNTIENSAGDEA